MQLISLGSSAEEVPAPVKIALYVPYNPKYLWQDSAPPLGVGYLASYAARLHSGLDLMLCRNEREVFGCKPDLLGISAATICFKHSVDLARRVKETLGIPVILGGAHISALPHTLPSAFDAAVLGEGEATFSELITLFSTGKASPDEFSRVQGIAYHRNGQVDISAPRPQFADLDSLPFPDRDLLGCNWQLRPEQVTYLITTRGCPYSCAFCASAQHWRTYRSHSPEYVLRELEYVIAKYHPQEIGFYDDLFLADKLRFGKIQSMIRERGLHRQVFFSMLARSNTITEETADLLAGMNVQMIDIGFESASQRVLDYFNKTGTTPETNQRALDLLTTRGIRVGGFFTFGAAIETREDMLETVEFVESNRCKFERASFGPVLPYPGTRLWDEALERDLVSKTMDWDLYDPGEPEHLDPTHLPYMGRGVSLEDYHALTSRLGRIMQQIDHESRSRKLCRTIDARDATIGDLRRELNTMKGSRLVRGALSVRNLLRRWRGQADARKDDPGSSAALQSPPGQAACACCEENAPGEPACHP